MDKVFVFDSVDHIFGHELLPGQRRARFVAEQLALDVLQHVDVVRSVDDTIAPQDFAQVFRLVLKLVVFGPAERQRVVGVRQLCPRTGQLDGFDFDGIAPPELDRCHAGNVKSQTTDDKRVEQIRYQNNSARDYQCKAGHAGSLLGSYALMRLKSRVKATFEIMTWRVGW